jgi:hypothetical protein
MTQIISDIINGIKTVVVERGWGKTQTGKMANV